MAKPVEGRVAAAHFGCCVCCVLCVVVVTSFTLTGRLAKIGPAKMADFSALITKNASLEEVSFLVQSLCF
jgi:hypothetical protein